MPRIIEGHKFFLAREVSGMVGVHRLTLLRWLKQGKIPEPRRDRHGWRLFSTEDVEAVKAFAFRIEGGRDAPETTENQLRLFDAPAPQRRSAGAA